MKQLFKSAGLPAVAVELGFIGLALRRLLYIFAVDDKGLLITRHPLAVALWLLTALAAAMFALTLRKLQKNPEDRGYTPEGRWPQQDILRRLWVLA